MEQVVIFVDSKSRDLMGTALIAHHLEKRGVGCRLEPLEAWRACVSAWKPDFLLFNHLNARHLEAFTQKCREWGVLTGFLPNEGIFYIEGGLEYNSRKQFPKTHCDRVFCWNEQHRQALIAENFCESPEEIIAVGVPRFDFYKAPWKRLFTGKVKKGDRPLILVNANFPLAHFEELPARDADHLFSDWKTISPAYADYWGAIHANVRGRASLLRYLDALLAEEKYDVILKPHPREHPGLYRDYMAGLSEEKRARLRLADKEGITELILAADLEISCENCTTTMEAWIAGKPTIGLILEKHPLFYTPEVGALTPECSRPEDLTGLVEQALANPGQTEYAAARQGHMKKWLHRVDGQAAERVANEIIQSIRERKRPKKIQPGLSDLRRGAKLRIARFFGEPVHVSPQLFLRRILRGEKGKQTMRYRNYIKSIRPADERWARDQVASVDDSASA